MRRFYRKYQEQWGLLNVLDLKFRELLQPRRERDNPSSVLRPSLPPVLIFALSFWVSTALCYEGLYFVEDYTAYFSLFALAVLTGIIVLAVKKLKRDSLKRSTGILFLVAGAFIAGLLFSSLAAINLVNECVDIENGVKIIGFRMQEDANTGNYGGYGDAIVFDENGRSYDARVSLSSSDDLPLYGETYSCTGTLKPPDESYAQSMWENGLCGTVKVYNVERHKALGPLEAVSTLRKNVIKAIQSAEGIDSAKAVLEALVCGYRVDLYQNDIYDNFKIAGLAHLVAVSGAHLSLVCMLAGWALRKLRLRNKTVIAIQALILIGFLAFSAFPISAVRAAIMSLACLASAFTRRRASTLNALAVCIIVIVALSPTAALSISFVLSVTSVLGIALFTRLFQSWAGAKQQSRSNSIIESISLTFSASILSTPVSACMFSQIPLVSPLANLVAGPLFTVICGLGLIGSLLSVGLPAIGIFVLNGAVSLCSVLCAIVSFLAHIPYASIPFFGNIPGAILVSAVCAAALWLFWPQFKVASLGLAAAVVTLVVVFGLTGQSESSGVQLVALNIGQGDSLLVRDRDNTVLVDTGREDQMLLSALARQGVYHLDAIVITHGDEDHMGSLDALRGIVQVDRVIVCSFAKSCSCTNCKKLISSAESLVGSDNIVGVNVGTKIACGAWNLSVIWPDNFSDEGGNADSLTLLATADVDADGKSDARALLVGDCEDEQLDQMIKLNKVDTVDIYKVGHHGSRKAIDVDTARELSPKISLVSVGENKYGHPVSSTLDALRQAGSAIYRTDQCGDVTCNINANKVSVSTQN